MTTFAVLKNYFGENEAIQWYGEPVTRFLHRAPHKVLLCHLATYGGLSECLSRRSLTKMLPLSVATSCGHRSNSGLSHSGSGSSLSLPARRCGRRRPQWPFSTPASWRRPRRAAGPVCAPSPPETLHSAAASRRLPGGLHLKRSTGPQTS